MFSNINMIFPLICATLVSVFYYHIFFSLYLQCHDGNHSTKDHGQFVNKKLKKEKSYHSMNENGSTQLGLSVKWNTPIFHGSLMRNEFSIFPHTYLQNIRHFPLSRK